MKKRNLKNEKSNKSQQNESLSWRYRFLIVVCVLILASGFFFAARQHFSAIEYGIKNAKLRQQRDDLENVQRQLNLTKEISLSPIEIKKAAKKIGFQDYAAKGVEMISTKVQNIASSAEKVAERKLTQGFLSKSPDKSDEKTKNEKNTETKTKSQSVQADNIRPRVVGK